MSLGTTATSPSASTPHLDSPVSSERPALQKVDANTAEIKGDAAVHAVDTFSRGALQWGYFLLLNAIAGSIAVAFFIAVIYADGLDPYLMGTYEWLLAHPGVTSSLAFSPLACSLLVGYGYASRARKRKKLAAQRAAQSKVQPEAPQTASSG
jgi:hypothetical protein